MDIPRKIFYDKELSFRLSRSYGPGRYDVEYEEKGNDYPYDYVRWTEQRNMEAFLQLLGDGKIAVKPLITHRFMVEDAVQAYELISGAANEPFLGVILKYPELSRRDDSIELRRISVEKDASVKERIKIGVLGAGNFATATLLPVLKKLEDIDLIAIRSAGGTTARHAAEKFGFSYCTSDTGKILADSNINTVVILTRHNQHAPQVIAALKAGKNVYVEKPLCLTNEELDEIVAVYEANVAKPALMVGFNRRFAPFIVELRKHLAQIHEPLILNYRVNAGFIAKDHWTQDIEEGGGRLIGEGCHFIDLLIHLANSRPTRVLSRALPDNGRYSRDNFVVSLEFANGSIATLTYTANGDKGFSKELLEVFGGGLTAQIDNYRTMSLRRGRLNLRRKARLRQDKGYADEWRKFTAHLRGHESCPLPFADAVLTTQATLAAYRSLLEGRPIELIPAPSSVPPEASE